MKEIKFLLFVFILVFALSCDKKPIDEPKPDLPEDEIILPDKEYKVSTTLNLIEAKYLGEVEDTNVASYQMIIEVDYGVEELTSGTQDALEFEAPLKIKDVFYLTLIAPPSLDAMYPHLEEGEYVSSTEKKLNSIFIGDIENGGSYVVSTIGDEESQQSLDEITIVIGNQDNKLAFEIIIDKESENLPNANYELKYSGSGEEQFTNESGIEYLQFNTSGKYNRIWYWGPANGFRTPENRDEELGEYLFEFSNMSGRDVAKAGEVYVPFYLMDEYQVYGIDAKIKPGVYPVNTTSSKGVANTIFRFDLESDDLPYSSSVSIKTFEKGKTYVEDGYMAVFENEKGVVDRYVVHFVTVDGEKFYGRYDGTLKVGDEWTLASLRNDVNIDKFSKAYMWLKDQTWQYKNAETNFWQLYLLGNGVNHSIDEYGYDVFSGPGDVIQLEISTEMSVTDAIPVGSYPIANNFEAGYAQQGNKGIAYIGIYMGSFYIKLASPNNPNSFNVSTALSGNVDISKDGDEYTIDVTMTDDAKNTITAKYKGAITIEDRRTSNSAQIKASKFGYSFMDYKHKQEKQYSNTFIERSQMRVNQAEKLFVK